jgi:DNA-binding LacI/PurR family transcriptional regulator
MLVSPLMSDDALRALGPTPLVLSNRLLDGLPSVVTDATEAVGHAVEHLAALGHREIVYLAGPEGFANTMRVRGYDGACRRLGLRPRRLGPFNARFSDGVRAADLVLATPATAVVAYNDEVAVGVLNRLVDRGLRVPDDLSVVGVDDTSLAEMVTPRLTTVRLPAAESGRAAVRMLLDVITGRPGPDGPLLLQAELIVRSSTGPVRVHE